MEIAKQTTQRIVHNGFLKVHKRSYTVPKYSGGSMDITREVVSQGRKVVGVLPIDETAKSFLLVEQWRAGCEDRITEIIAGYVDEGEHPYEAAERELREETGCEPFGQPEHIRTVYTSPGVSDEYIKIYLTRYETDSYKGIRHNREEGEDILVQQFSFDSIPGLLNSIVDAKTVIALRELQHRLMTEYI